jgi:hypothetical protein
MNSCYLFFSKCMTKRKKNSESYQPTLLQSEKKALIPLTGYTVVLYTLQARRKV